MAERALRLLHPRTREVRSLVRTPTSLVVAAAAVVVVVALIYLVARQSSMFAVTRVEISGVTPAVANQARAALRFANGQSLLRLDGGGVVSALEHLPSVYRATYDRDFPHTLRVRIVPERPVAILRRGADSWIVSARGRVIAPLARGALPSFPRIWLGAGALVRLGDLVQDRSGALASRALSSLRGAGLGGRISFVKADGGRIVAGLRTGLEIRFGPPVELGLKLAVARSILPLLATPSAGGPRYLDVAAPERPVAGSNPQLEG
jgi:cell division septal protein FtsQ